MRKHVQETIKKDNTQYIGKTKSKSLVTLRVSPKKSPKKLTDLIIERKKPYDKE